MTAQRHSLIWLWAALLVFVFDQGSKYLAVAQLNYGEPVRLFAQADLTLLYNYGAAFSFLSGAGGWQRWFFVLVAIVVSIVLVRWLASVSRNLWWMGLGLSSVLGGALGNLYDRIIHGYVVDFISLHYQGYYFPAFNLADAAITLGAIILIIDMIWLSSHEQEADDDNADPNQPGRQS